MHPTLAAVGCPVQTADNTIFRYTTSAGLIVSLTFALMKILAVAIAMNPFTWPRKNQCRNSGVERAVSHGLGRETFRKMCHETDVLILHVTLKSLAGVSQRVEKFHTDSKIYISGSEIWYLIFDRRYWNGFCELKKYKIPFKKVKNTSGAEQPLFIILEKPPRRRWNKLQWIQRR